VSPLDDRRAGARRRPDPHGAVGAAPRSVPDERAFNECNRPHSPARPLASTNPPNWSEQIHAKTPFPPTWRTAAQPATGSPLI
jgi:hypothetical protein